MSGDSGTPTDWMTALSAQVVNVHCVCDVETAAARFLRRTRHRGHLDSGERIDIDTSAEPELNALVLAIRTACDEVI
jgi:hypothetical protein